MHNRKDTTVYILSCVEDGGVYRYQLRPDGTLNLVDKTPCDRPMYAVLSAGKLYVLLRQPFAASEDSGLVTFQVENGALKHPSLPCSTQGAVGCHLCVDDGEVYAANYISGSIIRMPDRRILHQGKSVHPQRQTAPHAHFVGVTPDGRYICAADLGIDKLLLYDKQLQPVSETVVRAGNGPRHLAFSEDGQYAYCANELSSTVTVLSYSDGKMQPLGEYSTLPAGYQGKNAPAAIRYHQGWLYISNRGHDSIACFRAEADHLKLAHITDCGGRSPRDFHILGDRLVCTNEESDTVTVFAVRDGSLTYLSETPLKKPLCVVFGAD